MTRIRGSELLVQVLEENNVQYIFGVPGDIENEFFADLKGSQIEFFNTMHEQSGAIMADVYARLTDDLGVCFSTLGPGATNMLTGVANANQDRSSLLALSGQLPSGSQHQDSHQYVELDSLYEPVSKESFVVQRGVDIGVDINRAINEAKSGRKGAVHVSLPIDTLKGDATSHRTAEYSQTSSFQYESALVDLYAAITDSDSTLAIIGKCVNAHREVKGFVEAYNIPFYTSFQGKGVVPASHSLNCGVLSRHSEVVKDTLQDQDLILTIGYDLIEGVSPETWNGVETVAHIDRAAPTGPVHINSPDIEVTGDISAILAEMVTEYEPVKQEVDDISSMVWKIEAPEGIENNYPLHPAKIVKTLNSLLGDRDIVIPDVGLHKQAVGLYYEAEQPNTVLFSNGLSQMGFCVPASIVAQFICPEQNVVGVSGDCGFHMNVQELTVAVQREIPVTYIVFNDGGYGMVKAAQLTSEGTQYAAELPTRCDFATIAEGFGATGFTVDSAEELEDTLSQAISAEEVTVVDIPIEQYSDIEMIQ